METFLKEVKLAATILTTYEAILDGDGKKAVDTLLESRYDTDDEGQIIERYRGDDSEKVTEEVALTLALSEVARYVDQRPKYYCPGLDWRHIAERTKDYSDLKHYWRFENLVGAMYCFCDDACRQQHRYYTKIKPARLKKGSRKGTGG